ncbi:Ras-related protein Rab-8A [Eumeta japonica]|uniref:Ras-related protein Rab-8A n=1 Tax=Eumeta variegata TaxID=151549 RepID=A0A4C1Y0K9_EUMVA|nr:Ras-related protein Rab-8A [Eumeta japonica]
MALDFSATYKLLVLGDSNVGKTCIVHRYCDERYYDVYISTIGIDFKQKIINLDGVPVKLQIWDTAGQERFRTLTTAYYRGAMGIILMYDITNLESFNHLSYWLRNIQEYASPDVIKVLVGNKCDVHENHRAVPKERGQKVSYDYLTGNSLYSVVDIDNNSTPSPPPHEYTPIHLSFYSLHYASALLYPLSVFLYTSGSDATRGSLVAHICSTHTDSYTHTQHSHLSQSTPTIITSHPLTNIADDFDMPFFEVSCKSNINIEEAFVTLARKIREYRDSKFKTSTVSRYRSVTGNGIEIANRSSSEIESGSEIGNGTKVEIDRGTEVRIKIEYRYKKQYLDEN